MGKSDTIFRQNLVLYHTENWDLGKCLQNERDYKELHILWLEEGMGSLFYFDVKNKNKGKIEEYSHFSVYQTKFNVYFTQFRTQNAAEDCHICI